MIIPAEFQDTVIFDRRTARSDRKSGLPDPLMHGNVKQPISWRRLNPVSRVLTTAAAYRFTHYFGDPPVNNEGGAAAPIIGVDIDSLGRAVGRAGSALHAGVEVDNPGLFPLQLEDAVRADGHAHAAADTSPLIKSQDCGAVDIPECFHLDPLSPEMALPATTRCRRRRRYIETATLCASLFQHRTAM